MDPIDRQQAKDTVVDTVHAIVKKENTYISVIITAIVQEIGRLPSAQKTGKWAYKTTDAYIQRTCSACGWSERVYHRNQDGLIRNYCPNCGAYMRGEEE